MLNINNQEFLDFFYNYLLDNEIIGAEALEVATDLDGYNLKTLNDVLYIKTGYRDLEQYTEYEDKQTYEEIYGGGIG